MRFIEVIKRVASAFNAINFYQPHQPHQPLLTANSVFRIQLRHGGWDAGPLFFARLADEQLGADSLSPAAFAACDFYF